MKGDWENGKGEGGFIGRSRRGLAPGEETVCSHGSQFAVLGFGGWEGEEEEDWEEA